MQIVIVSDFGDVNGGAAKVAIASARALANAGISVTFVCAVAPASPELNHARVTVFCLGLENIWKRASRVSAAMQGIWHQEARRALADILDGLPPGETVVHFHQWTKAFSPSVFLAPLRRGFPSVVSLHDYFFVCPNGAYYRYPEQKPCDLVPMSASCLTAACDRSGGAHKFVRVLRQYATNRAAARAGASLSVVSVSPFADRVAAPFIGANHARFVVRSPIDAPRLPAAPAGENRDFLFVGRLTEEKGVRLLAQAARETGLPLTIAGDGPLLSELRGLGGGVRCTGWLDTQAVLEEMRKARALVFPSTWYETGGLVVLEALAQGIPVIVSRTTAAADFVTDAVNGFLVAPGDLGALKASMVKLSNPETATRMGLNAHRLYWDNPATPEVHAADLIAVYRKILAARAAS